MSRIMKKFIALNPKMYNGHVDKKAKGIEKYVIKTNQIPRLQRLPRN